MQSNAPKPRAVSGDPPAGQTAAPAAVPTQLDLVIDCALDGSNKRALLDICMDLFSKLESSMVASRQEFVDSYFATLVKQDEMTSLWTDPSYYEHLRLIIHKEVLPLYDRYCAVRDQVSASTQKRSWPRYSLWTIGVGLGLELIFSGGRILRPPALIPAVIVDGLLGYALCYVVNFREISTLKRANRSLLNSIRAIDNKHDVAKRYEAFRSFAGGELLTAEFQLLLASYGSPDEFWNDYYAVRKADPATQAEVEKLGRKKFDVFLQSHVLGACSFEARQQRFNALFLLAHKTFILNDPHNYVLRHSHDK